MTKNFFVGIDLGTTFSAIATINSYGKPEVILNSDNERVTPSIIAFEDEGPVIGREALTVLAAEPERVVQCVKRHMGEPDFSFNGYGPAKLSSLILKKLVHDAQTRLEGEIKGAVITVPAYFLDSERKMTIEAGNLAGLEVLRLINEPTAAALAYGFMEKRQEQRILCYDLGGGTFDITLMYIEPDRVTVIGTDGESHLGGRDWDDVLINIMCDRFIDEHGTDPRDDPAALGSLWEKANLAKHELSVRMHTRVVVNYSGASSRVEITRKDFEAATAALLEQTETKVLCVLEAAGIRKNEIDAVLPVGGSTKMPMVSSMLTRIFSMHPLSGVNPDEAVALGAAIMAGMEVGHRGFSGPISEGRSGTGLEVLDVVSHSLGTLVLDEQGLPRNSIIIPKNTPIPCKISKDNYVNSYDNQTNLQIRLIQGEDPDPDKGVPLGVYEFSGVPPRPRGESRIDIAFEYDKSGIIHVNATDIITGQRLFRRVIEEDCYDTILSQGLTYIFLLIDCSGSMEMAISDVKKAAREFIVKALKENNLPPGGQAQSGWVDTSATGLTAYSKNNGLVRSPVLATGLKRYNIDNRSYVGIVSFGRDYGYRMDHQLSDDADSLFAAVERIKAGGETYMASAIGLAGKELTAQGPGRKIIILLTDGCPKDLPMTVRNADRARSLGIQVITIGLGAKVNKALLKRISTNEENSLHTDESSGLMRIFGNLATEIKISRTTSDF